MMPSTSRPVGIAGLSVAVVVLVGMCALFENRMSEADLGEAAEEIQRDVPQVVAGLEGFDFELRRDLREVSCANEALFGEELDSKTSLRAELMAEAGSEEEAQAGVEAAENLQPPEGWESSGVEDFSQSSSDAESGVTFTRSWDNDVLEVDLRVEHFVLDDEEEHAVRIYLMSNCINHSDNDRSRGDYSLKGSL